MVRVVLDASALLAALAGEPGAAIVEKHLEHASMSAVNLSEVVAVLSRRGVPADRVREALEPLDLDLHPFDATDAWSSGELARVTKNAGLSLGDRACLALGKRLARPVVTADRSWRDLKAGVKVIVIR
jgi:PIN domain nuclease of toxin-antitoxin system